MTKGADDYLINEHSKNVRNKARRLVFFIVVGISIMVAILGAMLFFEYKDQEVSSGLDSWAEGEKASWMAEPVSMAIDIEPDESLVSFEEMVQKVDISKVGDNIYLIPKSSSSVEVYESDNKQIIIRIKK